MRLNLLSCHRDTYNRECMDATYHKPKLRWPIDINVHSVSSDGGDATEAREDKAPEKVLVIRCPLGVSPKPLVLVAAVAPVVSLFQGELTISEILARCAPYGLQEDTLRDLIKLLDEGLFLANARFFAAERQLKESFLDLSVRPPALAGLAYPATELELRRSIEDLLVEPLHKTWDRPLRCLVAPHIDYRRGGSCYGRIYPYLASSVADTYVLIGTAHQYSERMFHLSAKDFQSPLGVLPCRTEFVSRLASRYGMKRAFEDEFLHKQEHSLELQLPFISAVKPGVAIVPILVGSFHRALGAGRGLSEFDEYESFVGALVETIREEERDGRKVCFIAGVDMAHVGRVFGDDWDLSKERMEVIATRDAHYLDAIVTHDHARIFAHIAEDMDARRICGFPTMYTVLDALARLGIQLRCEMRTYDQAVDYQGGCAVTFAGLALTE